MSTLSGFLRSATAVPSARNSGLDRISNLMPRSLAFSTRLILWAVRTGRVDFSMTILGPSATLEMLRAASSLTRSDTGTQKQHEE